MLDFQPLSELQSGLDSWEPESLDCLDRAIPAFGIISLMNPDSTSLEKVEAFVAQQSTPQDNGAENSVTTITDKDDLSPVHQFYIHSLDQLAFQLSEASDESLAQILIQLQEWSLFLYHIKTPPSITTMRYLEILESRTRKIHINSECAHTLHSWKSHYQLPDLELMPAIANLLVGSERALANHFHKYWTNWGNTDTVGESPVPGPIYASFERVDLERTGLLAADTMEGAPFKANFKKLGMELNFSSDGHYVQVHIEKVKSLVKGILSIELNYATGNFGTTPDEKYYIGSPRHNNRKVPS